MTIPKQLDIMGIPYVVEEVETVDRSSKRWGQINYEEQTIRLDKALATETKNQVFIHELVHAILANIGQDNWNNDETAVQSFAAALYHVLSTQAIFS